MTVSALTRPGERRRLVVKLSEIDWTFCAAITVIAVAGGAMLYSVAGGEWKPWAAQHLIRYGLWFVVMIALATLDLQVWFALAYPVYAVGLVLALARFYHSLSGRRAKLSWWLLIPALLIAMPVALVMKQPDLGTALLIAAVGITMMILAGLSLKLVGAGAALVAGVIPVAHKILKPYQWTRLTTFLNPDADKSGAGYHTIQAKIAVGSGGLLGKGFGLGSQSELNFLPEKQTDFIFTTLAEEFGLAGGLGLLALYTVIIVWGFALALRSRNQFGRLLGLGIVTSFFLSVFINAAMVMGMIPVVGVPLPLISYGGTAMLAVMLGFGLVINVGVHRDTRLNRRGERQPA